jgi:aspartate aminotransferase-like enzyme
MMGTNNLLMIPGPTNVPQRVYAAMSKPLINHRGEEFRKLYISLLENLKKIFQTENDVFVLTSSGTGGVECAASNILLPNEKIIVPVFGTFSERFSEAFKTYGCNVIEIKIDLGDAPLLEHIEDAIRKNPDAKAVGIVYNETSTGVTVRDLPKICEIAKNNGMITIVDAISILAGDDLPVDKWNIDVCIGGSQKSLAAPPGLAFISVSKDAWKMIERAKPRSDYFNLIRYREYRDKQRETPFTPAINLFYALDEAIKMILEYGLEKWIERHKISSKAYYSAFSSMGLSFFAKEYCRSNTIITINMPNGISGKKLRELLLSKYGIAVASGFGELKDKIIRIGNMGIINARDVLTVISSIEASLYELGYNINLGIGISKAIPIIKDLK